MPARQTEPAAVENEDRHRRQHAQHGRHVGELCGAIHADRHDDGGRVLRAILWFRSGDLMRATFRAARIGRLRALALIAFGVVRLLGGDFFGLWLALIGWCIVQAGSASLARASLRQALGEMRVRDVMTTEVRTVPADATLHDLIEEYFIRYTYGGYTVVKDGRVVGLVTLRELRDMPVAGRATTRVERVMVPLEAGLVVDPGTPMVDALDWMLTGRARRLVVLERERLVSLITANRIVHLTEVRSCSVAESHPRTAARSRSPLDLLAP
jgi:CBS domain-containing protein